jgi:hypothetical protein
MRTRTGSSAAWHHRNRPEVTISRLSCCGRAKLCGTTSPPSASKSAVLKSNDPALSPPAHDVPRGLSRGLFAVMVPTAEVKHWCSRTKHNRKHQSNADNATATIANAACTVDILANPAAHVASMVANTQGAIIWSCARRHLPLDQSAGGVAHSLPPRARLHP